MYIENKELEALKKKLDVALGSHANLLGVKSQQFDKKNVTYDQRKQQSFNIEVARIADIAFSASSGCNLDELGNSRSKMYYVGKKPVSLYLQLIEKYAKKAASWGLVTLADGRVKSLQNESTKIAEKCGNYLKDVHSSNVYDLKAHQIRSLNTIGEIISIYPDTDEIDFQGIGISKPLGMSIVSTLETLGVVKRFPSGKLVPYPVYEVHSEEALETLDDALADPLSRFILRLIHKMPGISIGKLVSFLPELDESRFEIFKEIIMKLVDNHVVVVFPDAMGDDKYIVPLWTVSFLLKASGDVTVIEPDMLRKLFVVSSSFWDNVSDLSKLDESLMVLREHLNDLVSKGHVSINELFQLGSPYAPLIGNLKYVGVLKIEGEDLIVVKKKTALITAVIEILGSSLTTEFEPLHKQTLSSEHAKEYNEALQKIHEVIQDKLSPNDLYKFKGLKE